MPKQIRAIPGWLWIIPYAMVVTLGVFAAGPNVIPGDEAISDAIQRWQGSLPQALTNAGNLIGSTLGGLVVGIATILVLAAVRYWKSVGFMAIVLALRIAATLAKPIFESPRPTPDLVRIVGAWDGSGFPSGHAMTSMTMCLGLAALLWPHVVNRQIRMVMGFLLTAVVVVVGFARIWSGAHWPSDVLGGYLLGTAIVLAASAVITPTLPAGRRSGRPAVVDVERGAGDR